MGEVRLARRRDAACGREEGDLDGLASFALCPRDIFKFPVVVADGVQIFVDIFISQYGLIDLAGCTVYGAECRMWGEICSDET